MVVLMTEPSINTQRAFYDRMWENIPAAQLNNHEKARLCAIKGALDRLELGSACTVLDVGCGRGWLSGLLLRHYGQVTAYDLSIEPIAKARESFPGVDFQTRDVMSDPPDGGYDLVVSSEVIEHIQDQQRFVDNLVDVTKPSGHLVLTTPNARLRTRWGSEGGFTPQPIEKWLRRAELRGMLGRRCVVRESATFFFDIGGGGVHRAITNRPARMARGKFPQIDRGLGRTDLGLYQYAVARRTDS
jgi:cyclopropane fatty-acyl-phospholipid synthase-like methyltransferase